ncbi:hypothetical protein [Paludisphaera rhizosphaerae]|uniref:hypothetical protein n=1 Tax=Paludisphaera rhizosphaerae TaxID=2711216 RepID=UPI0013EDBE68|nr:hypothetical protein [Paludisphaera rhizosphaerae]
MSDAEAWGDHQRTALLRRKRTQEKWTPERIESSQAMLLVRLTSQGVPQWAAGRILGLSLATVKRRLKGLEPERIRQLEHRNF